MVVCLESAPGRHANVASPDSTISNKSKHIARHARAALLCGLGVFLSLQVGLAVLIEYRRPELRDPLYAPRARRLAERTHAGPVRPLTVVMLGSSRTRFGFDPRGVEQELVKRFARPVVVFNFGIDGSGPLMELIHLKRLLVGGVRPDLVLIEVLPALLDGHAPCADLGRLSPERLWHHELALVERYAETDGERTAEWWQGWAVPWHTHRLKIAAWAAPQLVPLNVRTGWFTSANDWGWAPPVEDHSPAAHARALETAHAMYIGKLTGFQLGGVGCRALEELLEVCREEKIHAALVVMPEGPVFRSWYPSYAWGQIEIYVTELSREFDTPFVSAREWMAEEDFSDSHHLLPDRAAVFSARLNREAIMPLLEEKKSHP